VDIFIQFTTIKFRNKNIFILFYFILSTLFNLKHTGGIPEKNIKLIMNKLFNQAWKYFAGGATVLAYSAWFERIKTPQKTLEFKNEIHSQFDSVQHKISELQVQISESLDEDTKNQLTEKITELTSYLTNLKSIHNKYFQKFEEGNISVDSDSSISLYTKYKEQIDQTFNQANTKAQEIVNILDNKKDKFALQGDNPIFNIIKDFKEYLASLSVMEICLVINITSCVFIITCIISILFAISGNYLIDKFSLENKLPKLSKIIQFRVKFQRYYIIVNSIFIIITVLSLIFVNTITLING